MDKKRLLERAEGCFLKGDYNSAMKLYSLLLKEDPQLKDAIVGVSLCDLGSESEEDAQALFDYYQSIKDEAEDADEIIEQLLNTIVESRVVITKELNKILQSRGNEGENGISYEDFKKLVKERGDFKKTFEDIIFSTKVIISKKEDFIEFIKDLIKSGYGDIALEYLDRYSNAYISNQDILELYNLIEKK